MANTVYFDPGVGGSGLIVTDDGDYHTGLDNDGHRVRFVPALAQVVAVAQHVVDVANDANVSSAALNAAVAAAEGARDASITAKTGSETAASLSQAWATQLLTPVAGIDYSSKYYAILSQQAISTINAIVSTTAIDGGDASTTSWVDNITGGNAL